MEDTREEDMEETVVEDMETAVVGIETEEDMVDTPAVVVAGTDMGDVEEDTVPTDVATEATTVAALGVVLMLVRLYKLGQ